MTSERSNVRFIQGNEAVAEGALYAGLQFYAGYPITPSTEIAETLAVRLPEVGGTFIQMEDEVASMCTIIGASLTGLKVMTATSGPGFSLMQEAIGYAIMAEVPSVIVNVQRGGAQHGPAHRCGTGRRPPGQVGHPWRPRHRHTYRVQPSGRVSHDGGGIQHGRDLSDARYSSA